MHYLDVMQRLQPRDHLNKELPHFCLREMGFFLLVLQYFLVEISIVGVLHDDAEGVARLVDEHVFVLDHVRVVH